MYNHLKWTVFKIGSPFIFLILFSFSTNAQSHSDFYLSKEIQSAYNNFLELKLNKAEKTITDYRKHNPKNGLGILINNYYDFIHLLISSDENEYQRLKKNESIRINKLKKLNNSSPYYLYCIAEIKFQWAFVKIIFDDKISGLWSMRSSFRMIKENQIKYPDFLPNQKTLGLMEIVLGSVPDENKWILNSLGLKGNFLTGLNYLTNVSNSGHLFSIEAKLYKELVNIYILKKETEGIGSLKKLSFENPDNLMIHFLYVSSLAKSGYNDRAIEAFENFILSTEHTQFPSLHYIKGTCYLNKLLYNNAKEELSLFISIHKGKNYLKSAYYKLYIANFLENKKTMLKNIRTKALINGNTEIDADKDAEAFFKATNTIPNKELLEARLLFDGGYYNNSLNILNSLSNLSKKDNIELNYRKARNYHGLTKLKTSIRFYKTCIYLQGENEESFLAPNSCLQLGYIYLKLGDKPNAKRYFEKALTYKKHQYKSSINNKAKAALQDLNKK